MLKDVHPAPVGGAGEAPDHRVMPRRAAARLQEPAENWEHRVVHRRHRQHGANPIPVEEHRVDALQAHRIAAPYREIPLAVGMENVEHAALAHHHVVVEVPLQALPQLQRLLVEARVAGQHVVRADDGRVAAAVAEADRPLFDHRDIGDPMLACEIMGSRKTVASAPHDHDVVSRLRFRLAPGELPAAVAAQTFREEPPA